MSSLVGTGALVRSIAARDQVRLLAWMGGIVLLVVVTASSTKGLYQTQADLDEAAAASRDNPAALAFNGPDQALDTIGGQVAFQVGAFGLVMVGLMSVLLVSRVTRGEEDSGRLELIRALPVGRHAPLTAGLLVVGGAQLLLGAIVGLSLMALDLPTAGSLVLGASFSAFGLTFAAITAVTAQVTANPRVASGTAGAVLGLTFAVRAVGDVGDGTLSWLSPMGWAQKARPYAGEQAWALLLCVGLAAGLVWSARALAVRRDFGAGLVADKPGPPIASPGLSSPLGLAVRLHRAASGWWAFSALTLGLVYGSLADSIDDFVGDNEALEDMLASVGAASLTDSYLSTSLLIMAVTAAGSAIQIALRLRSEETAHRMEAILATGTSRLAWAGSHLVSAMAAGALTMLSGGLGLGLGYAVTGGGAGQITRLLGAAMVYVPAVWVLAGLAAMLFGLVPRSTAVAWVGLVGCLVVGMFGALLELPAWVRGISPFEHTPAMPGEAFRLVPVLAVLLVGTALTGVGLAAFRSRDLSTS
jgi:ABC-2 type transport system permease protein